MAATQQQNGAAMRPVLITGASSGIGLELARLYAAQGRALILVARNVEKLDAVATELRGLHAVFAEAPQLVSTISLDVADAAAVNEKLAERVQTSTPDSVPSLVINAAGVVNVGRFLEMDPDYFADNLRIDLEGTINVCRAVAPAMVEAGSGHIVNIASVAGYLGIYGYTGYSAAKFAVMGFSEALRFELKPLGVDVSVVCPPDTLTPGLETERANRPAETEKIAGGIAALDPRVVATKIARAIEKRHFYIIIGATSKFYFRLKGLLPEIFFAIVDGDVRKVREQKS
ncbi:MAG: SDR family oxidoreductase [Coriobacteriia bacterium]|nr:SDR family oxidoreductase [Coriobacteriia bacterium]MCL2537371.1 SDR family oxidoreductase [Coriobacteriia bacterium]